VDVGDTYDATEEEIVSLSPIQIKRKVKKSYIKEKSKSITIIGGFDVY
jgi:hypothetical protein